MVGARWAKGPGASPPLLPSLPIRGLGLWAALIPFLLSVLEKIKIYNPLPHPTGLHLEHLFWWGSQEAGEYAEGVPENS